MSPQGIEDARRRMRSGRGRVPPQDLDAEQALLGACLLKTDAVGAALDVVSPEDFYRPAHGHIFEAIIALYTKGAAVDPITVADELARAGLLEAVGGLVGLTALAGDTPASGNAGRYARIVADLATLRQLIATAGEIAEEGYSKPSDVGAAVARAVQLVGDVAARTSSDAGEQLWPVLDDAGWHGPFGAYALEAAAYTEADPVGILVCSLAAFGAYVGASPHMNAGNVRHGVRIFPVLVGQTAKARKGSGYAAADRLLWMVASEFHKHRVIGGFNSGEAIADAFTAPDGTKPDVRLLCLEPEFGRFLTAAGRDGSTMSMITRHGWDGKMIETRARSAKVVVEEHHLVVIGQITAEELRAKLSTDDLHNGFANRFLWTAVHRGELQSNGGNIPDEVAQPAAEAMSAAAAKARRRGLLTRDADAEARWDQVYREIATDDPPGVLGAVISRGDAQTMRLAMLYALADGAATIGTVHIEAAYALWRYCRTSAAWIWGSAAADPVAQRVLAALTENPRGLNGRALHGLFHRNLPPGKLNAALESLAGQGFVASVKVPTAGRPSSVFTLNERTNKTKEGRPE